MNKKENRRRWGGVRNTKLFKKVEERKCADAEEECDEHSVMTIEE